jgi:hypothetical protein
MVTFKKVTGARWAVIQGREVDMVELRRGLNEMFESSEIVRVLGSPILS